MHSITSSKSMQSTNRIQVKVYLYSINNFLFHWVIDADDSGIIISEDILKDIPRYNEISWK